MCIYKSQYISRINLQCYEIWNWGQEWPQRVWELAHTVRCDLIGAAVGSLLKN